MLDYMSVNSQQLNEKFRNTEYKSAIKKTGAARFGHICAFSKDTPKHLGARKKKGLLI